MSDALALQLLDELLGLSGQDRERRMEQLAERDVQLHSRLKRLLAFAAADDSSRVLSQPVMDELQAAASDAVLMLEPGGIVSGYRLLRELGRGGTSVVWLAERADGVVKREVALKIPSVVFAGRLERERFVREKDVLASLNHAHIARLYDAGVIADKHPFIALEYVDGAPITAYCDRERLSIADRLRLFLQVIEAVGYAHNRLVVHRDLKPSNILVDAHGQAKLLDFGIAKALGEADREATQLTRYGQIVGTPQYMSPEQSVVTTNDVDARSDIYSLGVVLYELLAGALPFNLSTPGNGDYASLPNRDAPTPSRRFAKSQHADRIAERRGSDATALRKHLSGDLDWIVMKAIEQDRSRRYQTADAFATDITRYLDLLPVLARPPTVGYVLNRFVRRNRVLAASVGLAAVSLIGGAILATMGLIRALEAERQAIVEAETSQQVTNFLVGLFEVSDPGEARGNSITAREVLDRGAQRLRTELREQPRVQAQLLTTVGHVYMALGLYRDALPLAEQALHTHRAVAPNSIAVADSLDQVGKLLTLLSKPVEATALHTEALQLRRETESTPSSAQVDSLEAIGLSWMQQQNFEKALDAFMEARRLQQSLTESPAKQRATLASHIGEVHHFLDRLAEAEPFYREAIDILRRDVGVDHPHLAAALTNLSILLKDTNRRAEAIATNDEALAIYKKVYGDKHPQIAQLQNNIALLHLAEGNLDEALSRIDESVRSNRELLGADHEETNITRINRGRILARRGDHAAAEREFRDVLNRRRAALPAGHFEIGLTLDALAASLNQQRRFAEAAVVGREATDIMRAQMGPDHSRTASAEIGLATALAGVGQFSEAEPLLLHAYAVAERGRGRTIGTARAAGEQLVKLYERTDRPTKAVEYKSKLTELQ